MEGLSVRHRAESILVNASGKHTPLLVIDITSVAAVILRALTGLRPLRLHELGYTIPGTVDTGDSSSFVFGHIAFYEQGKGCDSGLHGCKGDKGPGGRRLKAAIAADTAGRIRLERVKATEHCPDMHWY